MELRSESDKLTINCYKGNKTYVQGKQCVLFQKVISYAIEKLPNKNTVIETLNRYHVLNIEEIEVINQSKMLLPNLPIEMADKKHCNNLFSAVFNTMLVGYMPDYTCLITPVFRALEYYLHRIIHDEFGKNTIKANGSNNFAYFSRDKTTGEYTYNSNTDGFNEEKIGYLNELYNFYNRIRHPYSHWSQESIDTQVITEMDVARELLLEGLKLINKYYTIFKHLTFS